MFERKAKPEEIEIPSIDIEEKISQLNEKQVIQQNERGIKITEEFWGPLWKYINDEDVTDIDFNGYDLRIRTTTKKKHRVDENLSIDFVDALSNRIANEVAKEFNVQNPVLEAETDNLRISVLHETRNKRGKSICIRRVPKINRITVKSALEKKYVSPNALSFLINCVHAHCNFTISGEIGSGKTELGKFLSSFIPEDERVITVEDNYELQYSSIKPNADCVEIHVDNNFTYDMAIKAALRQNAKWLVVAEVRDKEAKSYLKQLSSGVNGITTLHTDDARNIPSRITNMIGETEGTQTYLEDAFTFLNVGIYLGIKVKNDGTIYRYIDQICVFENSAGKHIAKLIYANGRPMDEDMNSILPPQFAKKLIKEGIEYPFSCAEVENTDYLIQYNDEDFEEEITKRVILKDKSESSAKLGGSEELLFGNLTENKPRRREEKI